ncbi:related to L-asparaginase [Desulfotalea psychrophila LSv54]|uniref:Related to L-asparaginase n=2 Tax=Desulfotalea psychrophila TaxID=84980 RepID=Q6APK1_DESPS|nr:related to L-asparaginase [Desulfotalea psychrophila LSv54]
MTVRGEPISSSVIRPASESEPTPCRSFHFSSHPAQEDPMKNNKIAVFITGGTIGMSPSDSGLGVSPDNNFEQILASLAPRDDIEVEAIFWADIPSPHMTPEHMLQLAHDIDQLLEKNDYSGAVVLHGTDLLAETSFVLNVSLTTSKPVITTGSMRHLGEAGYDGIRNLQNGLIACTSLPPGGDVLVQMADWLFSAQDAIKQDSLSVDPFVSQSRGAVGRIAAGTLILNQNISKRANKIGKKVEGISANVVLVTAYPGMPGSLLINLLNQGIEGLVIEGFGAGNIPPTAVGAVRHILQAGIPVVLASRCIRGGVAPIYDYPGGGAELIDMGCISAGALNGTKALLLLKIAISNQVDRSSLQELFSL